MAEEDDPIVSEHELRQIEVSAAMGDLTPRDTRRLIATVRALWVERPPT